MIKQGKGGGGEVCEPQEPDFVRFYTVDVVSRLQVLFQVYYIEYTGSYI